MIGTGSLNNNEIKRMFILPQYQGKGYGSMLMDELEAKAYALGYLKIFLDSSLPGYNLYVKREYVPKNYKRLITKNNQVLCYNEMVKEITDINCIELCLKLALEQ